MQLIQKGGAQKIENKSVFQNRVRNDTMMTQSPKKQGSRSPEKKPRLTQKNDDEPSPGGSDEFVDIDDELIQDDEYGDYDEEDDTTTSASPNSKKNKFKSSTKSDFQRQRSAGSSENTSRYDPQNVANQMLQKKDRKIPHSVFKPHADTVVLLHSTQYSNNDLPKVIFAYPKYCQRNDSAPSFLSVENKILNIESGINGPKFLQIIRLT